MEFGKRHDRTDTTDFARTNFLQTCCGLVTGKSPTCYRIRICYSSNCSCPRQTQHACFCLSNTMHNIGQNIKSLRTRLQRHLWTDLYQMRKLASPYHIEVKIFSSLKYYMHMHGYKLTSTDRFPCKHWKISNGHAYFCNGSSDPLHIWSNNETTINAK